MHNYKKFILIFFIIFFNKLWTSDGCTAIGNVCSEISDIANKTCKNTTEFSLFSNNFSTALNYLNQYLTANTTLNNLTRDYAAEPKTISVSGTYSDIYDPDGKWYALYSQLDPKLNPNLKTSDQLTFSDSSRQISIIIAIGSCADFSQGDPSNNIDKGKDFDTLIAWLQAGGQGSVSLPASCGTMLQGVPSAAQALQSAQIQLINYLKTNSMCLKDKILDDLNKIKDDTTKNIILAELFALINSLFDQYKIKPTMGNSKPGGTYKEMLDSIPELNQLIRAIATKLKITNDQASQMIQNPTYADILNLIPLKTIEIDATTTYSIYDAFPEKIINSIIEKMKNTLDYWTCLCTKEQKDIAAGQLKDQQKMQDDAYAKQQEAQACDTTFVLISDPNATESYAVVGPGVTATVPTEDAGKLIELDKINSIADFLNNNPNCAKQWNTIASKLSNYHNQSTDDQLCSRIRYAYDHPGCIAQLKQQQQYLEQKRSGLIQQKFGEFQSWMGLGVGVLGQAGMIGFMAYQHKYPPKQAIENAPKPAETKPTDTKPIDKPTEIKPTEVKPLSGAEATKFEKAINAEKIEERLGQLKNDPEITSIKSQLDFENFATVDTGFERMAGRFENATSRLNKFKSGEIEMTQAEIEEALAQARSAVNEMKDIANQAKESTSMIEESEEAAKAENFGSEASKAEEALAEIEKFHIAE